MSFPPRWGTSTSVGSKNRQKGGCRRCNMMDTFFDNLNNKANKLLRYSKTFESNQHIYIAVRCGCRMHRLLLCRVTPHLQRVSWYDIKHSVGEASALEIWRMWSTPSLLLFPSPLCPGVVEPDRVLSMGQIEQVMRNQTTDAKLWVLYSNTWHKIL